MSIIRDLQVVYFSNLLFNKRIDFIPEEALRIFGFISQNSNIKTLIILYVSQLRLVFVYESFVWLRYRNSSKDRSAYVLTKMFKYSYFS